MNDNSKLAEKCFAELQAFKTKLEMDMPKIEKFVIDHMPVIGGKYLHYKGGIYEVIMIAKDCNNDAHKINWQVIYKSGDSVFTRRIMEFFEKVNCDGNMVPRFKLMEG